MRIIVEEDIALPQLALFEKLTRFDALLARMARHNATLERLDHPAPPGVGSTWRGKVEIHGLKRDCEARLVEISPPDSFRIDGKSDGIDALIEASLVAVSDELTTLTLEIALSPTGLRGRVLVNSLRLMQGPISRRLAGRVRRFAREVGRPTA